MIKYRIHGLLMLQMLMMVVILPFWFLFTVFVAVEVFDKINYAQINFPIYILGIISAALFTFYPYQRTLPRGPNRFQWVEVIRQTNTDIFVMSLMLFGIVFATKDKAVSRIFLGSHIVSTWCLLLMLNRYLPKLLSRIIFREGSTINTIFVGSNRTIGRLTEWVHHQSPIGIKVLGLVSYDDATINDPEVPLLGVISELENILREQNVQQVVLLESRHSKTWVNYVTDTCFRAGCRLLINNPWEEFFEQPLKAVIEGEHTFFTISSEPLENPVNRFLKRLMDVIISLPVVLFFLPPLCIWIKFMQIAQSTGPLFHKQLRSGIQGKHFEIFKFRTMDIISANSADEADQARPDDERVYPFGRFLRRRSLDEFPQFFNVLLGSMSIVGPRPHLIEHDKEFALLVNIYRTRHFVKPGITGLAQHKGYRGEITEIDHIRERIRFDLEYIGLWSIWLDIGIILKTFCQLFVPPQTAY